MTSELLGAPAEDEREDASEGVLEALADDELEVAADDVLGATPEGVREQTKDKYVPPVQDPDIVAVAGFKGGVGKSRLAKELAAALQAVLTDFEWDGGSNTREWGWLESKRQRSPLIDAFKSGRTPRPLSGRGRKPDLIPGHSSFQLEQPTAEVVTDSLVQWSGDLRRRLVVDTHPGGCPSTFGAMAAARVTVVPVVLGVYELNALESMLGELGHYPLLLIPYKVGRAPAAWAVKRLTDLVKAHDAIVGPTIGNFPWIKDRQNRVPIVASPVSARSEPFVKQLLKVAEAVDAYGR